MQKWIKVKKSVNKDIQNKVINWDYEIYDENWEKIEIICTESSYKYKLSNNKNFMKRWIDRKIHKRIVENLRDIDLWFIYKIEPYIDSENIVDFKRFKVEYSYTDSKLSKAKKPLLEAWILKEHNTFIYLNPLVWIIGKEISQELIDIFQESIEKYWVKITI